MSYLCCCFGGYDEHTDPTPADPEVRRQQMLAAAEKRQKDAEFRGIKDTKKYQEQQKKMAKMEEMERKAVTTEGGTGMRWQVG